MHEHKHEQISSEDELLALIKYMVNHNKSHTEELKKLSARLEGSAELQQAIGAYEQGNAHLENVLEELEAKK